MFLLGAHLSPTGSCQMYTHAMPIVTCRIQLGQDLRTESIG